LHIRVHEDGIEASWRWRSELWAGRAQVTKRPTKTQRRHEPLILCGHGVALKIESGSLLVRNGFTHHPQEREEFRFFKGSLDIPSQIIMLDGSGNITFDVLNWLAEQNVALTRLTSRGEIATVSAPSGYAANPHRVKWQRETRADYAARMAWCIDLISRKIEGCILTLEKAVPRSSRWNAAMERAYADLSALELAPPHDIVGLRIIEANSAAAYFRAWRDIPIKWRGLTRNPIPDDWKSVGARTSEFALAGNRNASHPVNAMLNYAYTILESKQRLKAVAEGYDPTIGIMHEGGNGAAAFIFDIMEAQRAWVDRSILDFVRSQTFHPADFALRSDGVVRLNPQLARAIVSIVR
jgi:CRISPR-associated protein Cas1